MEQKALTESENPRLLTASIYVIKEYVVYVTKQAASNSN